MKEKKPIVRYLSTIPGSGKTRWSAQKILDNAHSKKLVLLYVAPRIELLEQMLNIEIPKLTEARDEVVYRVNKSGDPKLPHFSIMANDREEKVVQKIRDVINGTAEILKARKGDCLLITHSAFMKLPVIERANMGIIFDEAGYFLASSGNISLTYNDTLAKNKILKAISLKSPTKKVLTSFFRLLPNSFTREFMDSKDSMSMLSPRFRTILHKIINPKFEVYIKEYNKTSYFFDVVTPGYIFKGFTSIWVLSAYFESTQMYHVLARHYRLVNIENEVSSARQSAINRRYEKLKIYPLTNLQEPLSKNLTNYNLVVSKRHIGDLDALYNRAHKIDGVVYKTRLRFVQRVKVLMRAEDRLNLANPLIQDINRLVQKVKLEGVLEDPIMWFQQRAKLVIDVHASQNPRTLLTLNNDAVAKGHVDSDYTLMSCRAHGSNAHANCRRLVFLAALNPNMQFRQFMSLYLPDYDIFDDWVGNTLVQSVTRTSLRKQNTDEDVEVVVADIKTARILKAKLFDLPTIIKTPTSRNWETDYIMYGSKYKHKRGRLSDADKKAIKAAYSSKYYTDTFNLELNRLRARITNARKAIVNWEAKGNVLKTRLHKGKLKEAETAIRALFKKEGKTFVGKKL